MAGGNTITRRISLEGAEEIVESLKKLGEAGKEAFEKVQKGADAVKGPDPTVFDRLKKSLTEVGSGFIEAGKSITSFGVELSKVSAAVTGVIFGFALLGNSAAETADAIEKNAQKVGLTAEAYQKLSFAARQTDVEAETFTTGMGRLAKALENAREGGKDSIDTLQKLGLSLHDIETLTPDQALEKLADHFAKLPDGVEKSAEAIKVFGRGGIQLIPLLNSGSKGIAEFGAEFDRLTLGLSDDQIKISKTFIEQKHELEDVFTSLKNQLGLIFVPALTEAGKAVTDFVANNKVAIVSFVQGLVDSFSALPEPVKHLIEGFIAFTIVIGPIVVAIGLFVQAIGFALIGIGSLIGGIGTLVATIGAGLGIALEGAAVAVGLLLSPIGLTVLAIAALVAAIVFLAFEVAKNWDKISKAFSDATTKWKKLIGDVTTAIKKEAADWLTSVADAIDKMTLAANAIAQPFIDAFHAVTDGLIDMLVDIIGWVDKLIIENERAIESINALQKAKQAAGLGGGGAGGGGFAEGGPVVGPGTSTSDSIPARLSAGEFVVRARAVRRHGVGFMQRLNGLQMPRFALGGLVAPALSFASGGMVSADTAAATPVASVHLHIGGRQFPLSGPQQTVDDLMIAVRQSNLASAGKVPGV